MDSVEAVDFFEAFASSEIDTYIRRAVLALEEISEELHDIRNMKRRHHGLDPVDK
mgnify:CR=1 FL=1